MGCWKVYLQLVKLHKCYVEYYSVVICNKYNSSLAASDLFCCVQLTIYKVVKLQFTKWSS